MNADLVTLTTRNQPYFTFYAFFHMFGTAEARVFKFYTQVGLIECQRG